LNQLSQDYAISVFGSNYWIFWLYLLLVGKGFFWHWCYESFHEM